jgi:Na+/H+-dicarboxylate symporter
VKKLSLPVQLLLVIAGVVLFGSYLSEPVVRVCFTFSTVFKDLLSFLLPCILFTFVATGILSFKKNAPLVLAIMVGMIFISNALAALLTYFVAQRIIPFMKNAFSTECFTNNTLAPLQAYWSLQLPIPDNAGIMALLAALGAGLFLSFVPIPAIEQIIMKAKKIVEYVLMSFFIPFLPLYVLGFLLEVQYKGVFLQLFEQYGSAVVVIVALQIIYLGWLYFVATGFSVSKAKEAIGNALPSYLTAFSTMSSTATIPVSVVSAEKNTGNRPLADVAMPIMANVHLLGDGISTPMLALVTMSIFLCGMPTFLQYAFFVFYFCTSMFAASGVPGGGILVMIPILKSQLGFTPEMQSIIITIYMLMDSFGTAANVMGDGALVMMLNTVLKKIKIQ